MTCFNVRQLALAGSIATLCAFTASGQTQLWETTQTSSQTYTASESDAFTSPFAQDQEVADDFQVTGTIERLLVGGRGCGTCTTPVVLGVHVRFYEHTPSGPGELQHHVFIPEGDPGFLHEPKPYNLDITLPEPFVASGWHFVSVQIEFGPGGGVWRPKLGNYNSNTNAPVHFRNNLTQSPWVQDSFFGTPYNADYVLTMLGTLGAAAPVIDSLVQNTLERSGRIIVQGGLWGAEQAESQLLIDGIPAIVTQWNSDRIVAYVPEAASLGTVPVEVQTASGTSNATTLTVLPREQHGRVKWRFQVDANLMWNRPGVAPDGSIYINDYNNARLYKLSPEGGLLWAVDALRGQVGLGAEGPTLVGEDGTVYLAVNPLGPTVEIVAYNPDGTLKWVFTNPSSIGIAVGPAIGPDGNLYVAFNDFEPAMGAVSLTPEGDLRWSNPGSPFINEHGAFGAELTFSSSSGSGTPDQMIVAVDHDSQPVLYAFDIADGDQRWTTLFSFKDNMLMQQQVEAAASADGPIYVAEFAIGNTGSAMQAYNADGSHKWIFAPGIAGEQSAPAVGSDGVVYLGWDLARVSAVSTNGDEIWRFDGGPGSVRGVPVVSADNQTVLFSGGTSMEALNASTGELRFSVELQSDPSSHIVAYPRPAFAADNDTAYWPAILPAMPPGDAYCYLYAIDVTESEEQPGDINGDQLVDEQDRAALCSALGTAQGDAAYLGAADFDQNGAIDHLDQQTFNTFLPPCGGDVVSSETFQPPADGMVDGADLAFLLGAWGAQPSCADFVNSKTFAPPPDGMVDGADLAFMLGAWGTCN